MATVLFAHGHLVSRSCAGLLARLRLGLFFGGLMASLKEILLYVQANLLNINLSISILDWNKPSLVLRKLQAIERLYPFLPSHKKENVDLMLKEGIGFFEGKVSGEIWFPVLQRLMTQVVGIEPIAWELLTEQFHALLWKNQSYDEDLLHYLLAMPQWKNISQEDQDNLFSGLKSIYQSQKINQNQVLNFFNQQKIDLPVFSGHERDWDVDIYQKMMKCRLKQIKEKDWRMLYQCTQRLDLDFFLLLEKNGVDLLKLLQEACWHVLSQAPSSISSWDQGVLYISQIKQAQDFMCPHLWDDFRAYALYKIADQSREEKEELLAKTAPVSTSKKIHRL